MVGQVRCASFADVVGDPCGSVHVFEGDVGINRPMNQAMSMLASRTVYGTGPLSSCNNCICVANCVAAALLAVAIKLLKQLAR